MILFPITHLVSTHKIWSTLTDHRYISNMYYNLSLDLIISKVKVNVRYCVWVSQVGYLAPFFFILYMQAMCDTLDIELSKHNITSTSFAVLQINTGFLLKH